MVVIEIFRAKRIACQEDLNIFGTSVHVSFQSLVSENIVYMYIMHTIVLGNSIQNATLKTKGSEYIEILGVNTKSVNLYAILSIFSFYICFVCFFNTNVISSRREIYLWSEKK